MDDVVLDPEVMTYLTSRGEARVLKMEKTDNGELLIYMSTSVRRRIFCVRVPPDRWAPVLAK